jgi:hypothetical protein
MCAGRRSSAARGFLTRAGEVDHLHVLREEKHLLGVERLQHEVKAGRVDLVVYATRAEDRQPHDLDAELIRPDVRHAREHRELQQHQENRERHEDTAGEPAREHRRQRGQPTTELPERVARTTGITVAML